MQNLITSKFVAHFLEEVSVWQKKLSIADQVITVWFEVQRTWTHLESIFMSSEDIRKQLPEDSARFDGVDRDFKLLTKEMSKTPNVVVATNKPGLRERLEGLQKHLTLCEKALAQYLETKRLAFPRFYFVSSADLLDILSNGNQPEMVTRHLTKLFDSMAKLKFIDGDDVKPKNKEVDEESDESETEGNDEGEAEDSISKSSSSPELMLNQNIKIALGMYAKDGEYVEFNKNCKCGGPVSLVNYITSFIAEYFRALIKRF
ncbi:hypothetical protein J437_LFUL000859 [Ladona fulva]|uniref:Dynein heavy chain linker domain-containing protein n=1 Tax=Ladona fulva TaxID=123851 RepID=A0A8K0NU79_LADFU|nr:hypothetical protein J437_LFUL000859 [Ladona fulva]